MNRLDGQGGYRGLGSFQTATLIYDATYGFCEKFIEPHSRMAEHLVQAARSGRLNLAKGNRVAAASSKTDLRFLNLARAGLEELLLDYEDFLRHRKMAQWPSDGAEALTFQQIPQKGKPARSEAADLTALTDQQRWALYAPWLDHAEPGVRANAVICLIHQVNARLDQQIAALEKRFGEESDSPAPRPLARSGERRRPEAPKPDQPETPAAGESKPVCPTCGKAMVLRTAQSGRNAGKQFWGCTGYPECKGIVRA